MYFPTDAGDFTCLAGYFSVMWEILYACQESGRNTVQAGDSLSMRESWKPCYYCLNLAYMYEDISIDCVLFVVCVCVCVGGVCVCV